jgi:hypothetical protein
MTYSQYDCHYPPVESKRSWREEMWVQAEIRARTLASSTLSVATVLQILVSWNEIYDVQDNETQYAGTADCVSTCEEVRRPWGYVFAPCPREDTSSDVPLGSFI